MRTMDLRAPTSRTLAGSDAVHTDPDYSGAWVFLETDESDPSGNQVVGTGMTFTIGAGNDLCCSAIEQLGDQLVGRDLDELAGDPLATWRALTNHSQLRWLGPEKGVIHLATAALVNALWDLEAKRQHSRCGGSSPICPLRRSSVPSTSATCVTCSTRTRPQTC